MSVIVEEQSLDCFLITSLLDTVMSACFMFYAKLHMKQDMSRVVRKPAFCICENKDADDQRLCFRFLESTIPLLPKYEISSI